MTKRLDALMARDYESGGETKTAFTRIGAAFETKAGGWSVILEAMPAPVEGQYKILLMVPKPKDGQRQAPANQSKAASGDGGFSRDLDDEIPF